MLQTANTSPARERGCKKKKGKRLQRNVRSAGVEEEEKKAAASCRESSRAKKNESVRVQRLQREHTNILLTRVKEPNNLLSIKISDSLINYAH